MTTDTIDTTAMEEPLAELERHLIAAFIAGAGQDVQSLTSRHDDEARSLLAQASRYASEKMAEVEARSHYLHSLRGEV
jgi:hypothetical protein